MHVDNSDSVKVQSRLNSDSGTILWYITMRGYPFLYPGSGLEARTSSGVRVLAVPASRFNFEGYGMEVLAMNYNAPSGQRFSWAGKEMKRS